MALATLHATAASPRCCLVRRLGHLGCSERRRGAAAACLAHEWPRLTGLRGPRRPSALRARVAWVT
jgi:hypothetical protein